MFSSRRGVNIRGEIRSELALIDRADEESAGYYLLPRAEDGKEGREINIGEPDIERYK